MKAQGGNLGCACFFLRGAGGRSHQAARRHYPLDDLVVVSGKITGPASSPGLLRFRQTLNASSDQRGRLRNSVSPGPNLQTGSAVGSQTPI